MKQKYKCLIPFAATTLVAVLHLGCTATVADSADPIGKSSLESREGKDFVMDSSYFDSLVRFTDIASSNVHLINGCETGGVISPFCPKGVLTLSTTLTGLLYPAESPPRPDLHTFSIDMPEFSGSPPWPAPDYNAYFESFDSTGFSANLERDAIHARAEFKGHIHIHTTWPAPDADLYLDHIAIDTWFNVNEGRLELKDIKSDIKSRVECGIFNWCAHFVSNALPNLDAEVSQRMKTLLVAELAKPNVQNTFVSTVDKIAKNLGGFSGWSMYPKTGHIKDSAIRFYYTRTLPPTVPMGCTAGPSGRCPASVSIVCPETSSTIGDDFILKRNIGGVYKEVTRGYENTSKTAISMVDFVSVEYDAKFDYKVCTSNELGEACTDSFSLTMPGWHYCPRPSEPSPCGSRPCPRPLPSVILE